MSTVIKLLSNPIFLGDTVRLNAGPVLDVSGNPILSPTGATLVIKRPDSTTYATITFPSIVNDGSGNFHYDLNIPTTEQWGQWAALWTFNNGSSVGEFGNPFSVNQFNGLQIMGGNQNETVLVFAVFPTTTGDPTSPVSGQAWVNQTTDLLRYVDIRSGSTVNIIRPVVTVSLSGPDIYGDYGPHTGGTTTLGINEALSALTTGGEVRVVRGSASGTASFSGTINFKTNATGSLKLTGESKQAVVLTYTGSGKAVDMGVQTPQGSELGGLQLVNGGTATYMVYIEGGSEFKLRDMRLDIASTASIGVYGNVASDHERSSFEDIHCLGPVVFGTVSSGQLVNLTTWKNVTMDDGLVIGPSTAGGTANTFIGCNIIDSRAAANTAILNYGNNTVLQNCANEFNNTIVNNGGLGTGGAANLIIDGCDFIPAISGGLGNLGVYNNGTQATGNEGQAGTGLRIEISNCRGQDVAYDNRSPNFGANPPVSGTIYQAGFNGNGIKLYLPVTFSPTGGAAATLATFLDPGPGTPASTAAMKYHLPVESFPISGPTGQIRNIVVEVPAGWFYAFTVANATLGTMVAVTR